MNNTPNNYYPTAPTGYQNPTQPTGYQKSTPPKRNGNKNPISTIIRIAMLFLVLIIAYIIAVNFKLKMPYGSKDKVDIQALLLSGSESERYNTALDYIKSENHIEAYTLLKSLGNYKDSKTRLNDFVIVCEREVTSYDDENFFVSGSWTYDNNGNLQKETGFSFENAETLIFDDTGKPIGNNGEFHSETEYTYDSNGYCIEEKYVDSKGEEHTYKYEYDSSGNRTKLIDYNPVRASIIHQYVYDQKGNCTEEFVDGEKIYEYTYDANNNLLKKYNCKIGQATEENSYDERGNCIQSIQTRDDGVYILEYTYDRNNNKTKAISVGPDGRMVYEYTYDDSGVRIAKEVCTDQNGKKTIKEYENYLVFYKPKKK